MFASGAAAFNEIADFINTLDKGVTWKSVGHILERSYLQKARLEEEHAFDVLTFSTKTCIVNTNGHNTRFYVRKQEDGYPAIKGMRLAGAAHPFLLADGHISTSVTIAAGKTACLDIDYVGGDSVPPEVSKSSVRVWMLRTISDWRDQYLSHFRIGRFIITAYYGNVRSTGTKALTIVAAVCVGWIMHVWLRRRVTRTFGRRAPQL
jgi:hypothetical protein